MGMQQLDARPNWRLWLEWVVWCVVGGAVGVTIVRVAFGIVDWPAFGIVFGLVQWLVLRPYLRGSVIPWITATTIGGTIGFLVKFWGVYLASQVWIAFFCNIVAGIAFGGVLGLTQWMVLRRHVTGAAWWLVASIAGCVAAEFAAIAAQQFWFGWMGEGGDGVAAWSAFGLVYGVITGVMMVVLLRQTAQQQPSVHAIPVRIR